MSVINRIEQCPLLCPECGSDEVYYENAVSGSGKYTCQDCEFMGEQEEFNHAISHSDLTEILALARAGEKMRWIAVEERLPEEEDVYLVFVQCNGQSAVMMEDFFYRFSSHVTHWMPLPAVPEKE